MWPFQGNSKAAYEPVRGINSAIPAWITRPAEFRYSSGGLREGVKTPSLIFCIRQPGVAYCNSSVKHQAAFGLPRWRARSSDPPINDPLMNTWGTVDFPDIARTVASL